MKNLFLKVLGKQKTRLVLPSVLVMVALAPIAAMATDPSYINYGEITGQPPQIDASNFVNYGIMEFAANVLGAGDPFTTSGTLNFSNLVSFPGSGLMICSPGWRFDYEPVNVGVAQPAANFFNDNLGLIYAVDSIAVTGLGGELTPLGPSWLFVNATNIVNHGALLAGANGWFEIHGNNVDLSRGVLGIIPTSTSLEALGSYNNAPVVNAGEFEPDVAVYDQYWGQTNMDFRVAGLWVTNRNLGALIASPPPPPYPQSGGQVPPRSFSLYDPIAESYTNASGFYAVTRTNTDGSVVSDVILATNVYKQAVFVGVVPGASAQIGFTPSTQLTNLFQTASVLITVPVPNPLQFAPQTASVYIQDQLASESGRGLLTNVLYGTQRPTNYLVSRIDQGLGRPGNGGYPELNFFLDSGMRFWDGNSTNIGFDMVTNLINPVTGAYSTYGAYFDSLASQPVSTSGTVTNLPGRVRIYADTLDLTKTLIRGEGEVIVQTPHLISSSETKIDCQNLSFNLGSTNGNLKVQNLAGPDVTRFLGNLYLWSGLWSNSVTVVITNNYILTNITVTNIVGGVTNVVTNTVPLESDLTNFFTVNYHTLMVDAYNLGPTQVPVTVFDLFTHSTNVVEDDDMTVVQSFLIDGQSLTLNGNMTLSGTTLANQFGPAATVSVPNWTYTNAPNLLYFTNNGSLSLQVAPAVAHFGDDRPIPYSDFVNNGSVSASAIRVDSTYLENNGALSAPGQIYLQGETGVLQNGNSSIGGVGWFVFNDLKLDHYQTTAGGQVYFSVTNSLSDGGANSANTFQFQDGFYLLNKPNAGDLLGTTFRSVAPRLVSSSVQVDHVWAGEDRGMANWGFANNVATNAGYWNNEAVGRLVLSSPSPDPLFVFSGAGAANGLYVDQLDLSALGTNFLHEIQINPNLTIYYAAARLGFVPPADTNGVPQEPEEYLDGLFNGHLRWVQNYAGPNSSTAVIINGQSFEVNSALRNSRRIDSNGDGIPNYYDPNPFNTPAPKLTSAMAETNQPPTKAFAISWLATPNTAYQVQFTTNASLSGWQAWLNVTNDTSTNRTLTIWDTNVVPYQRYYRVKSNP